MLTSLSLRFRIFLLFLAVALASAGLVCVSLYLGYFRSGEGGVASGFMFAGIVSVFGLLGISAGIWLLFDENVAKPIERMAATMRTRAHTDAAMEPDLVDAPYLGDLAHAVKAVTGQLNKASAGAEEIVAIETAQLAAERAHLAVLLTEIPVAIILVSPNHKIVLYDGQAAEVLGQVHVPRLSASIFDYFEEEDIRAAHSKLSRSRKETLVKARGTRGNLSFDLRLKTLSQASGYMILVDEAHARIGPEAARPLIYDFDVAEKPAERAIEDTKLRDLEFVVFDTETTGLMPNKDEIVQIGAVRVVNGRIVPGETIDQLVNPGRSIPAASTNVHGVTNEMVVNAPDPQTAASNLHAFARGAVIVAHNAPFDMAFLHRQAGMSGLSWDHPTLDTVLLSAVVFGASETHTLDEVCARLGIAIPEELRHTALGDAQATAEALCKMLPVLESRGLTTFGAVIQETRKHGRILKDLN